MSVILFIRSNGLNKRNYAKKIKAMGYEIAVVEKGYTNSEKFADYVIDSDTNNLDTLVSDIARFGMEHKIEAIIGVSEFAIEAASAVSEILSYNCTPYKAVKTCRNKFLTRIALKQNGLPVPNFFIAHSLEEIKANIDDLKYPVIIKPLNSAGSCSVAKINNKSELEEKFSGISDNRDKMPVNDYITDTTENYWLIEEFLDGIEISVESYTFNGETNVLAIHDKMCEIDEPYFLEKVFVTPSPRISKEMNDTIVDLTKKSLQAVGFDNGVTHVEYRLTERGPIVLEINGRMGGGLVLESVYYSTGVDLLEVLLDIRLNKNPNIEIHNRENVVFYMLTAPEGKIRKISGFEEAKNIKELELVEQWVKEGTEIKARQANYAGFILAKGDDSNKLLQIIKNAEENIKFEME